jgi:hypothetical protein
MTDYNFKFPQYSYITDDGPAGKHFIMARMLDLDNSFDCPESYVLSNSKGETYIYSASVIERNFELYNEEEHG